MPKIKVYKHDGKAVPVDRAKVSTGYECPWTKKLYLTKKSYLLHLKSIREEHIRRINRSKRINAAIADLNSQPNFESIIKWIETNGWFFLANAKQNYSLGDRWPEPEDFWIKIRYLKVNQYDSVSNSHSCPRDGIRNWGRDSDLPSGYPGWSGVIDFEISESLPAFGSDLFKHTGIHLGTGGGRGKRAYSYEVRFYDSDWREFDKQRVLAILSEKKNNATFIYGSRMK